jgi:hypothetical protein
VEAHTGARPLSPLATLFLYLYSHSAIDTGTITGAVERTAFRIRIDSNTTQQTCA